MKKIFLTLAMSSIVFCSFSQVDNPDCLDKTIPLFTPMDGFYLDWCKYSEFGTTDFVVDRGGGSITKEGVYREIWFRKKEANTRIVSGLQILRNHQNAIEAVGGKIEKRSDGDLFITTYNGKELWIYVNSSPGSANQDNYGNVYIVGHTDNVGSYDMNQKLSKSRGESVKNYLVSKYSISATRLTGDGVGPVCPVTSNDTDEGKALNRRVEIVKK